jgi:hypothetical protein
MIHVGAVVRARSPTNPTASAWREWRRTSSPMASATRPKAREDYHGGSCRRLLEAMRIAGARGEPTEPDDLFQIMLGAREPGKGSAGSFCSACSRRTACCCRVINPTLIIWRVSSDREQRERAAERRCRYARISASAVRRGQRDQPSNQVRAPDGQSRGNRGQLAVPEMRPQQEELITSG